MMAKKCWQRNRSFWASIMVLLVLLAFNGALSQEQEFDDPYGGLKEQEFDDPYGGLKEQEFDDPYGGEELPDAGIDMRGVEEIDIDYVRIDEVLATDAGDVEELKDIIYKLVIKQTVTNAAPQSRETLVDPQTGMPLEIASSPIPASSVSCSTHLGCDACIENGCAWCIGARACKEDIPWQCQGDVDHISYSGVGKHLRCPTAEELAEKRREREERKGQADTAASAASTFSSPGQEQEQNQDGEEEKIQYASVTKDEHLSELSRRAELAESVSSGASYGATHPYETLSISPTASGGEIRKVYRKLSLLYHPDKNTDSSAQQLATVAFKDIVAAFEILGNPEKRAFFDDLGGESMESFNSEDAYERWGRKNENNFYQGHPYITPLSEALWETRVGKGNQLWLVQFYAPWCGHCQQNVPNVKKLAELLKDEEDIEVGAVNCVIEPRICGEWFAIRAYPSFLAVNDLHGTRQEYQDGIYEPEALATWVRKIAREWRYLLAQSNLHSITTAEQYHSAVINSTDFVIVAFMDGFECSSCKTAKTNAMRLSASLRGYSGVSVAIVNCDTSAMEAFCASQNLPNPPFAPVVKGFPMGNKTELTVGRVLYNSNEVEPHIALQMIEAIVRLLLADRLVAENSVGLTHDEGGYDVEKKKEEEDKNKQQPPPMEWNGPKRRVAVAWGGDSEGPPLTGPRIGF